MNKYFFSLIAFSVFTNISLAQDMEEVVVTSSLVDTSEITNPLYVIDGNEINDDITTSLGDAVDSYLGVSIADYGSAVGQPIIRGMSGPRVKILKNGMVNRDVSGLGADHLNDVDLNNIEQIEIVKGPSSLLYANGTIGGIINVVDDCVAPNNFDKPEFLVALENQSVNDGDTKAVNYKNNINGFNVNVGYKESKFGNFDVPNGAVIHEEEEEEGDEENLGYINNSDYAVEATKFGISKVGDWGYSGFSIDSLQSIYGIPFHGEEHDDHPVDPNAVPEVHEEERIFSTTDSESFTIKGLYNVNGNFVNSIAYTFRDSDYSLTEAHAEEEGHDDEEEEEEHAPTIFSNNATEYGAIFDISNDNMTQKVVFNFVDEDSSIVGEEAFMNPANNEEFTVGYYMSKDLEAFKLDFGMRLDQIDRTGSVTDEVHKDVDYYNIDDSTNSFAVSLGRELSDTVNMSIGYASVERLPSVIELFMNGPHMATGRLETGNPNLQSETSNNFDITFNFESGEYYGYASFYVNDVDNYITLMDEDDDHDDHDSHDPHHDDNDDDDHPVGEPHDPHENLIHADYVQEDAEFDGYEIELGRTMSLASGELTLSFGRDVVNAKFADGHNVPRINPARNVYSLSYKQDDIVFKLSMKDVDKQSDIGEGETATEAYQMLDTRLTKTFDLSGKSKLKVSLFGRNLLDEVARNHASFVKNEVPLPGRNYGIKFNLTY
ncbi:TonB-dependent receptor [Gammaproteobacteria bacterium]|nr:TonB-dependent receptor [Gammaproteobacteria bacterium]